MALTLWHLVLGLSLVWFTPGSSAHPAPVGEAVSGSPATASVKEVVRRDSFWSALLNDDVTYFVYLPPSYATKTGRNFPVVYWLHGSGGYPPGVLEMLASRFHSAIQEGRMPPAIIVFPDGFAATLWVNAADGGRPIEDMFVREFIPHIDSSFRTQANANGRLVEGASMGGYGAARFGLLYPELFGAISLINPGPMQPVLDPDNTPSAGRDVAQRTLDEVFGGDSSAFQRQSPWSLAANFAERECFGTKIRMVLGESDPITPNNLRFSRRLEDLGIAHEIEIVPEAGHNPRAMFARLGDGYWDFFAQAFTKDPSQTIACR